MDIKTKIQAYSNRLSSLWANIKGQGKTPSSPYFLKDRESVFYIIIYFFVFVYILTTILDYNLNGMQPEIPKGSIPNVLRNGNGLVFDDFLGAFDSWSFDGASRARFVSCLFQIVNEKFRIWLFNYVPPHPSLSLTWIFTLILSPIFLFRLMYNLTSSRTTSWGCVALYLLSPGCLSGVTMLFHPGRPLANFLVIFCLYLASEISLSSRSKETFSRNNFRLYCVLLFTLFLAFLTEESAWAAFICIPVLFSDIFITKRERILVSSLYLLPFILFLILVTFLVPIITEHLGFGTFRYWDYVRNLEGVEEGGALWEVFKFINVLLNGYYLLSTHIAPYPYVVEPIVHNFLKPTTICVYIVPFLYFLYLYTKLPYSEKRLFLRTLAALLLFTLFHTLISTRHMIVTRVCYYYGSVFSIFLVLPLSILLLSAGNGSLKTLNKLILILYLVVFAYNFDKINRSWHSTNDWMYSTSSFFKEEAEQMKGTNLTYSMVLEVWKNRYDKDALLEMKPRFPNGACWLFVELEYITTKASQGLVDYKPSGLKKIELTEEGLRLSSFLNREGPSALIDGDPRTFWHIDTKLPDSRWNWIELDLGGEKVVKVVRILPRADVNGQIWDGRRGFWEGSNDGHTWQEITKLQVDRPKLKGGKWATFILPEAPAFRYYRMRTGYHDLASLAEIELFN